MPAKAREAAGSARDAASEVVSTNGRGGSGTREALTRMGISMVSAGAGVAGGVVLARTALRRNRTALGVPVPDAPKIEFKGLAKQVGEAGRQFGRLAREVQAMREKAEQVGRAIG